MLRLRRGYALKQPLIAQRRDERGHIVIDVRHLHLKSRSQMRERLFQRVAIEQQLQRNQARVVEREVRLAVGVEYDGFWRRSVRITGRNFLKKHAFS